MKPMEVIEVGLTQSAQLSKVGNVILGEREEFIITLPPEKRNVIVFGGDAFNRTEGYVKNEIRQAIKRRESLIITGDQDLYESMSGKLMDYGYEVRVVGRSGWDCIRDLKGSDAQVVAHQISETLLFDAAPYAELHHILLKSVCLHVALDLPEDMCGLGTVYGMLIDISRKEDVLELRLADSSLAKEAYRVFLDAIYESGSNVSDVACELVDMLRAVQRIPTLRLADSRPLRLETVSKRLCAYFCIIDQKDNASSRLQNTLFISSALTWLKTIKREPQRRQMIDTNITVNFLLNDFTSLGGIPDWEWLLAALTGTPGINTSLIFNDVKQMMKMYAGVADVLMTACDTWLFMGTGDDDVAKFVADASKAFRSADMQLYFDNDGEWAFSDMGDAKMSIRPITEKSVLSLPQNKVIALRKGFGAIRLNRFGYSKYNMYNAI